MGGGAVRPPVTLSAATGSAQKGSACWLTEPLLCIGAPKLAESGRAGRWLAGWRWRVERTQDGWPGQARHGAHVAFTRVDGTC